jgi:hypothetical protein
MAQTAKPEAERAADTAKNAADKLAEQGRRAADQAAGVTREAADQAAEATREAAERAGDVARHGLHVVQRTTDALGGVQREVAQRSAEHAAELGRVFVDLLQEQTQHNLKTFAALTGAVDWDQAAKAVDWDRVARIQGEYLRVSVERTAQLVRRYLEAGQAVADTTANAADKQARKAG